MSDGEIATQLAVEVAGAGDVKDRAPPPLRARVNTGPGVHVALLFLFFPQAPLEPLANSHIITGRGPGCRPNSRLEAACHRADTAIQRVVDLFAAA